MPLIQPNPDQENSQFLQTVGNAAQNAQQYFGNEASEESMPFAAANAGMQAGVQGYIQGQQNARAN